MENWSKRLNNQKIVRMIKSRGICKTLGEAGQYLSELCYDLYYDNVLGISTLRNVSARNLKYDDPSCHKYTATDYKSFRKVMQHIKIRANKDVFLDYGSGMGRVLIMAANYPFRKVISVELSPKLNRTALSNIQNIRKKLKCKDIEVVQADASAYCLPPEVTVIYFYAPFSGETLNRVLDNVQNSLILEPRKLTIICRNPYYFEKELHRHNWLTKCAEYRDLSRHTYVIYEYKPQTCSMNMKS